jgi:hypothetical protein
MVRMARSVTITTPVPTLEEFGRSLGLSKRRQDSLLRLVQREETSGRSADRQRDASRTVNEKANAVGSKK